MKTRKFFFGILVLIMLFNISIVAFAANINSDGDSQDMTVLYGVSGGFVVTIPSSITIDEDGSDFFASASDVMIAYGKVLNVRISGDDYIDKWELIDINNSSNRLEYKIFYKNDTEHFVSNNDIIIAVKAGEAYNGEKSVNLVFDTNSKPTKAGTYSDTLTFTVEIEDDI